MTRRVLLHVGTPKTGTSALQDVLFRNRGRLLEQGVLYPGERFDAHFLAALDLMRLPWGGLEADALGAWDALAAQVRAHRGTTIISHEILARATRSQVSRALASLTAPERGGGGDETQVHLMVSVRDLVRQVPAEWQENLKHRSALSYRAFLEQVRDPDRSSRIGSWFWSVQEIPDILDRWGADLPPERVHVITVPPGGDDPALLWQRFSTAFGLDDLDLDLGETRANPSLGVAETALLRRINRRHLDLVPPAHYRDLVRELLVHQTLSQRTDSARLALPPDQRAWAQEVSRGWVAELRERGYDVVGDLEDLVSTRDVAFVDRDRARPAEVRDASLSAIAALLAENVRSREELDRLRGVEQHLLGELADRDRALARSYLRPSYRARERVVQRLRRGRAGRALLRVYRVARGRSSRSA